MIIIDMGSGNTCRNDKVLVAEMIGELAKVDPHRKATLKWQLWDEGGEPQCTRLTHDTFEYAFNLGMECGYRTTASVFDKPSLDYLLTFDIPFVKLANRPYLASLKRYIPRGIPVVMSFSPGEHGLSEYSMVCVSDYPAKLCQYEEATSWLLRNGISDHTVGLKLWDRYHPDTYEKHLRLPSSTGPDAGPWAATPRELEKVFSYGG